jgi:lipoyl(octanoyl) transferase
MTRRPLHVRHLGLVEYEDGLDAQRRCAQARAAGAIPDTLLLLQHPRVLTLGRGAERSNVLLPESALEQRGFGLFPTDRGGDVTYHGPGQLVGYPIFDLSPDRRDVRRYVRGIEECLIRLAGDQGIEAVRVEGRTGVWVDRREPGAPPPSAPPRWEKLGAIGVHLSRWITTHGFALNVTTRLDDFAAIVPCGIRDAGVCSLASLLAPRGLAAPAIGAVALRAERHAAEVWEAEPFAVEPEFESISLCVLREGLAGDELLLLLRTQDRGGFWQILTGRREPGESPLQTAARELVEETGLSPRLEEIQDLGYQHDFSIDPALLPGPSGTAPRFVRETAFGLRVPPGAEVRLDPREHQDHRWLAVEDGLRLLRHAGLQRAVRLLAEGDGGPARKGIEAPPLQLAAARGASADPANRIGLHGIASSAGREEVCVAQVTQVTQTAGWSANLEVGIEEVDREHGLQIDLLNLLDTLLAGGDRVRAAEAAERLADFTDAHFLSEELLMRLRSYDGYHLHVEEHRRLLDRLASIRRSEFAHNEARGLVEDLRRWFANHVRTMDRDFARFVQAGPASGPSQ